MNRFHSYIALFLLVAFIKVMAPEEAVLALHKHKHTEETFKSVVSLSKAHLSKAHQHCPIDDLYNGSFNFADSSISFRLLTSYSTTYPLAYGFVWKFTFPNNTYLRGPPVA